VKTSPMTLFVPDDMVNLKRGKKNLGEVKLICGIIDKECLRKGVVVEGVMTEEEARRCVRIGVHALNVPPMADGKSSDVLQMNWSTVNQRRNR